MGLEHGGAAAAPTVALRAPFGAAAPPGHGADDQPTTPASVTHVPGLKCYPCPRLFILGGPGGNPFQATAKKLPLLLQGQALSGKRLGRGGASRPKTTCQ